MRARAIFHPAPGGPLFGATPLVVRAARGACRACGALALGGRLKLETTAPPGAGAGYSTMAALASLRAVAQGFGARLTPDAEARLAREAEGAVDPLMLAEPGRALWASREARLVRLLPPPPAQLVVGGFWGAGERTDAGDARFAEASDLFEALERAFEAGDRREIGRIASESARRNLALRRGAAGLERHERLADLAVRHKAFGFSIAHTGSAVALLFAPDQLRDAAAARSALSALGVRTLKPYSASASSS